MRYALPMVLLLAACVGSAQPIWLKPGSTALAAEQDFLGCAAAANRDFPPNRRIRTSPSVTIGLGGCRGNFCSGFNNGVEIYDEDENKGLRARSVNVCMATKGYAQTRLPACPSGSVTPLASQPYDTRGLCVANGRIAAPVTGLAATR